MQLFWFIGYTLQIHYPACGDLTISMYKSNSVDVLIIPYLDALASIRIFLYRSSASSTVIISIAGCQLPLQSRETAFSKKAGKITTIEGLDVDGLSAMNYLQRVAHKTE
jgi:hypothetical protein